MGDSEDRLKIVIEKNTFYQKKSPDVEKEYQDLIDNVVATCKRLKQKVKNLDWTKAEFKRQIEEILVDLIRNEEYGIDAVLTLCGLSDEKFYRALSFLRIAHQLGMYESSSAWLKENFSTEWKMGAIKKRLKQDPEFASDVAQFLVGDNALICNVYSTYDLRKLSPRKFMFLEDDILDTLARYSHFGSYNAVKGKDPEQVVKDILDSMNIRYTSGTVEGIGRDIDVIIPSKKDPKIFIEVSYVGTTSSGMGDKAKTERDVVAVDIKKKFPEATFIIFVDGIGWLVRSSDLKRIIEAGDFVFTFSDDQLEEFKKLLPKFLSKEDYKPSLASLFK